MICIEFVYLYFSVLFCLSVSVKWLAVKTASEMTYTVSSGALNSTPSIHPAWSTNTPFYECQPPCRTTHQTVNSRQLTLCGCGSTHLEYTANWRRCSKFTVRRLWKRFSFKQSISQSISCIFRVVQVIKSLQDSLEVGNNLPGIISRHHLLT